MNDLLSIAGIVNDSVVDGPGVRLTVFTQGCNHYCEGCHNPKTWNINGGRTVIIKEIFEEYLKNPLLSGITFSGGEPFLQSEPLAELADMVHAVKGNVWCYTGYTLEELQALKIPSQLRLLNRVDALVDGEFRIAERDLSLLFRGSKNQRIWIRKDGEWRMHYDLEGF